MKKTDTKEHPQIDFSAMDRAELEEFALEKSNQVIALEAENSHYKELLRKGRSDRFGAKSERYVFEGQIDFLNEAEKEADPDAPEPGKADILPPPKKKRKKSKGHKKSLTDRLPKETIEYKLTDDERTCPKCSGELKEMKTVVRTEIEVVPATYKTVEHRSKVYSCRACDKKGTEGTIITAPSPNGMFTNSLASPGFVADIMFKKYALAQPLYRQAQELSRCGLDIGRNTLANWVVKGAQMYLMPIREHMKGILVSGGGPIHTDETPVEVLHEPGREAQTKSYMWVYRTGRHDKKKIILFDYTQGRGSEHPKAFLKGFKGYIHSDEFSAYGVLARESGTDPPGIVISACWSHARRKYTDIIKGLAKNVPINDTVTEKALLYIGKLFKIEEAAKDMSVAKRLDYRKEHAQPVVDEYFSWLKSIKDECTGSLSKAVNYNLNHETDLRVYLLDGRLDISNNLAENAIRPFCVGRRNWLFSDTPNGAEASAACYGLIETAKANRVNAFEYLRYIFSVFKNADISSLNLDDFMPWSPSLPDACRLADAEAANTS